MAAESMWPGLVQAEAGRRNAANVRNANDATDPILVIGIPM